MNVTVTKWSPVTTVTNNSIWQQKMQTKHLDMSIDGAQNITYLILIVLASLFRLLYYSAISKQETTVRC